MRVAVVGYGVEGRAAVEYWSPRAEVTVLAKSTPADFDVHLDCRFGEDYLDSLDKFDLVVRSPGVHPRLIASAHETTTVVREFLRETAATVVGVTGTQGKGTTATAITRILEAAGKRVFLGGNIGVPPLSALEWLGADDVAVLELSNLQLIDLDRSPHVSVILPITPDHLDWHSDLSEYYNSKNAIAEHQSEDDVVVFATKNNEATRIATLSRASTRYAVGPESDARVDDHGIIWFRDVRIASAAELSLIGAHNLFNLACAVAATFDLVGADVDVISTALRSLKPLPHRLQPIRTANDVLYVNDSLATSPAPCIAALRAFPGRKVLILGGSSKNADFRDLAREVAGSNVSLVLVTGAESTRIVEALAGVGFDRIEVVESDMREIVATAARAAEPGDTVLLSPACASFGAFLNYADRGNRFVAAVNSLRDHSDPPLPPRAEA